MTQYVHAFLYLIIPMVIGGVIGFVALAEVPRPTLEAYDIDEDLRPLTMENCVSFSLSTNGKIYEGIAEIALSPKELSRGMMYRQNIPESSAMFFDMQGQRNVKIWMKNTPSSLDIAFFNTGNMLVHIEPEATPFSEALVGPDGAHAISYVLEVPAGKAGHIGLIPDQTRLGISTPTPCREGSP